MYLQILYLSILVYRHIGQKKSVYILHNKLIIIDLPNVFVVGYNKFTIRLILLRLSSSINWSNGTYSYRNEVIVQLVEFEAKHR